MFYRSGSLVCCLYFEIIHVAKGFKQGGEREKEGRKGKRGRKRGGKGEREGRGEGRIKGGGKKGGKKGGRKGGRKGRKEGKEGREGGRPHLMTMPLSIEKLSLGSPAMFHSLILTWSPSVVLRENSSEHGMPLF